MFCSKIGLSDKLDSSDNIEIIIAGLNIIDVEKHYLKMQKYLAEYSGNYWQQFIMEHYPKINNGQDNSKNYIGILQSATKRDEMCADINGYDLDAFNGAFTAGGIAVIVLSGGEGILAAAAAGAIDGGIASYRRWRTIVNNHWYDT